MELTKEWEKKKEIKPRELVETVTWQISLSLRTVGPEPVFHEAS